MLKNTGSAIAAIGAGIGQTVAGMPQKFAAKKEREDQQAQKVKAWEAFQKDKGVVDIQYKAFKNMYKTRAQKLVDSGAMTDGELQANLQSFPMPREGDKVNKEAFDKYLGKGAPAYLDKFRLSAVEAITMITDAGGIPVLAHPFTLYCKSSDELDALVEKLVNQGLMDKEEANAFGENLYDNISSNKLAL